MSTSVQVRTTMPPRNTFSPATDSDDASARRIYEALLDINKGTNDLRTTIVELKQAVQYNGMETMRQGREMEKLEIECRRELGTEISRVESTVREFKDNLSRELNTKVSVAAFDVYDFASYMEKLEAVHDELKKLASVPDRLSKVESDMRVLMDNKKQAEGGWFVLVKTISVIAGVVGASGGVILWILAELRKSVLQK